jgi:hypothetical protein
MKTLIALLASLALLGCGGLDESLVSEVAGDVPPALESSPGVVPPEASMTTVILPPLTKAEVALLVDTLRLAQNPVEERFFYPVDLKPPPGLPTPPCPACR